jgi:hypothetical protein
MKMDKLKLFRIIFGCLFIVSVAYFGSHITVTYYPTIQKQFCGNGTLMDGYSISYCDGHPFKCQNNQCIYISVAEDTHTIIIGKVVRTVSEEVPLK